ncbi:VWA domain-containing protein [Caldanaerobius fijiensis]|uniref:VWA domain-containing protein n=1 Tax=Caldanaerobius fijiensis TaxID=456330 RepID=UPI0013566FBD|nr:VWA domain-containing protein [Caldanaerobius fijiensis]
MFNKLCIKAADVFTKVNEKVKKELKERAKRLEEIEKLLTEQHRPEFFTGYRAVKMINEIADKSITSLSEEEYERLSKYIRLNSAKFRTRISRSMKQAKSKQFDFKKTVQKSVQTFGVPFKLYYKKPIVKKTRIVCILDVSGSVIKYAQFFLQFIYELSSVFVDGVKSYVFVGDIDDITEYMTRYPLKEASKLATSAANISYRAYSDYNRAFRQFCDKYLGFVDRHTVVIILGDARNNKNESGLEYLYQIKKRAKTVLWLNPEKQSKWDTGDSIISRYKPHIDGLYQVTTFNELVSFLEQVVI